MKASAQDLIVGASWLRAELETLNEDIVLEDLIKAVERCIAFLDNEVERREAMSELASQKRRYAAENGLKPSQVRAVKYVNTK